MVQKLINDLDAGTIATTTEIEMQISGASASTKAVVSALLALQTFPTTAIFAKRTQTSDFSVNNDDALVDVTDAKLALSASKTYMLVAYIYYNTIASADMDTAWTLPTGATSRQVNATWQSSQTNTTDFTTRVFHAGTSTDRFTLTILHIVMSTTAGDAQLQMAQDVAQVSNTTIFAGTTLTAYEEG